jgi:hypothetical protein
VGHRQRPGVAAWRPSPRTLAFVSSRRSGGGGCSAGRDDAGPMVLRPALLLQKFRFCRRFPPIEIPGFPKGIRWGSPAQNKIFLPTNLWAAPFDRMPSQKKKAC